MKYNTPPQVDIHAEGEGTIKMETSPSQKSTGNSKADDVADFERKASEPYVQPDEIYHKEDND